MLYLVGFVVMVILLLLVMLLVMPLVVGLLDRFSVAINYDDYCERVSSWAAGRKPTPPAASKGEET